MGTRDATLHLRLPSDLKAALEAAAERDGRSVSNLVEKILSDWTKAQKLRR